MCNAIIALICLNEIIAHLRRSELKVWERLFNCVHQQQTTQTKSPVNDLDTTRRQLSSLCCGNTGSKTHHTHTHTRAKVSQTVKCIDE